MKVVKDILFLSAVIAIITIPVAAMFLQNGSRNTEEPIAIYSQSEVTDSTEYKLRDARGKKFGKYLAVQDLGDGFENLPINICTFKGAREYELLQSDAVLIGEIIETQSYLFDNKTNIYSEFTVRIEEVVRNTKANS